MKENKEMSQWRRALTLSSVHLFIIIAYRKETICAGEATSTELAIEQLVLGRFQTYHQVAAVWFTEPGTSFNYASRVLKKHSYDMNSKRNLMVYGSPGGVSGIGN
jgi:hypothetical protein